MITPLRGRDELDVAGLERLIELIVAQTISRAHKGEAFMGHQGSGPR